LRAPLPLTVPQPRGPWPSGDTGDAEVLDEQPQRATLTVSEAAIVLGVSRSTAYELARTGDLPSLRLGRRIVVPTDALRSLLAQAGG
jgi:excisionase family DNA binding protein